MTLAVVPTFPAITELQTVLPAELGEVVRVAGRPVGEALSHRGAGRGPEPRPLSAGVGGAQPHEVRLVLEHDGLHEAVLAGSQDFHLEATFERIVIKKNMNTNIRIFI